MLRILAERVHSQIKKKNDFWLLWIWLSCNLKILDNFATSVSTVSVLLKKVRSCRSVLFKLGEKINKKAAFYLSPSPFRWGPLSILTLTTMNAFNQKMSWKVRVKMSIELIWCVCKWAHRPEFSAISGTFIRDPARYQRHIRDFHWRPRRLIWKLIRKRSSNNREKKAENVEEGLRSTRLRINCFSKATFTIWLLKKKGQLNSI